MRWVLLACVAFVGACNSGQTRDASPPIVSSTSSSSATPPAAQTSDASWSPPSGKLHVDSPYPGGLSIVNDGDAPGKRSGDGAFSAARQDCVYDVSAPAVVGRSGGATRLDLTVADGCPWDVSSDVPFLRLDPPPIRLGSGSIGLAVDASSGPAERTGTLNLAGAAFPVRQLGDAAGPYDGNWNGETAQQRPIAFRIDRNEVLSLTLSFDVSVGFCHAAGTVTSEPSLKPVVQASAFQSSFLVSGPTGSALLDVHGAFASAASASGTFGVPLVTAGSNVCLGNDAIAWTASK